jgi:hypothetical protein
MFVLSFRSSLRGVVAIATPALIATGFVAFPAAAAARAPAAADPVPSCSRITCTVTYSTVGTGQSFTVPAGLSSLSVTLYGGRGGDNQSGVLGGDGALVTAALSVTHGEVLGIDAGGAGHSELAGGAGGVNGGGSGTHSGGGGGSTDITSAGTLLLVAGGGGGAGQSVLSDLCSGGTLNVAGGAGGNAGNPGGNGTTVTDGGLTLDGGGGGMPGTTSAAGGGGTAGAPTGSNSCGTGVSTGGGTAGSGRRGGSDNGFANGGGGGGGYLGGGSGGGGALESISDGFVVAGSGGGGGGSSYTSGPGVGNAKVSDTGNDGTVNNGNGEVVFSYPRPVADIAVTLACPAHMHVGGTNQCHLKVTDNGPDTATGVTATISLPSSVSEIYCHPGCHQNGATFTWTGRTLATGATGTFTLAISASSAGPADVHGKASAARRYRDPHPGNNSASAVITIARA